MMLNLTAFSQKDTDTIPVKSFPIPVVKLIIKDLLSGDSAKEQLKLTEQELILTQKQLLLKENIISEMKAKETNYLKIIDSEKQKFTIVENHSKKLAVDLKKEKVKSKFKGITGTLIIGVLTFFLLK